MKRIKIKSYFEIPQKYTGEVLYEDGDKIWYKNGRFHREDGPAFIRRDGYKQWNLNGNNIWDSTSILDLTNQYILSKSQHSNYPTVQVWKILNKDKVYDQIIIPGMEDYIQE